MSEQKMPDQKMSGWKTKAACWLGAIGTGTMAGALVSPTPEIGTWMLFVGTIVNAAAGALGFAGIAHKIEKAGQK